MINDNFSMKQKKDALEPQNVAITTKKLLKTNEDFFDLHQYRTLFFVLLFIFWTPLYLKVKKTSEEQKTDLRFN